MSDHTIPLFTPSDTPIPVLCQIPKFSGLVSPWQGGEGDRVHPKPGVPVRVPASRVSARGAVACLQGVPGHPGGMRI